MVVFRFRRILPPRRFAGKLGVREPSCPSSGCSTALASDKIRTDPWGFRAQSPQSHEFCLLAFVAARAVRMPVCFRIWVHAEVIGVVVVVAVVVCLGGICAEIIFFSNSGTLPSDSDPGFPFESHFEKKKIVPNPKKALRNIIGGEKRKDRLKRKEEAELERIIKSVPKKTVFNGAGESSKKAYLSDWREFQARIEATVTDTASRLESLRWTVEPTEDNDRPSQSDWANFEAHQEPEIEEDWADFGPEEEHSSDFPEREHQDLQVAATGEETNWADFSSLQTSDQSNTENKVPTVTACENWVLDLSSVQADRKIISAEFSASDNYNFESSTIKDISSGTREGLSPVEKETSVNELNSIKSEVMKSQLNQAHYSPDNQSPSPDEDVPSHEDKFSTYQQASIERSEPVVFQQLAAASPSEGDEGKWTIKDLPSEEGCSASPDQPGVKNSQEQYYGYDEPSSPTLDTAKIFPDAFEEPGTTLEHSVSSRSLTQEQSDEYNYDNHIQGEEALPENQVESHIGENPHYDEDVESGCHLVAEGRDTTKSDHDEIISNATDEGLSSEVVSLYTNFTKSKSPPARQGTLTENNPFRRASKIDNPGAADSGINAEEIALEDEKTTLATVTLFSQSVRDEDELEANNVGYEIDDVSEVSEFTTPTNRNFDPFQTIYPASEVDSSSDDQEKDLDLEVRKISIKNKKVNGPSKEEDTVSIPILPAPPKTADPAFADDLIGGSENDEFRAQIYAKNDNTLEECIDHSAVPAGWETFTSNTSPAETSSAKDDELVKAFEVDWSKPPVPSATLPEPPRPETPDPDLEIPFNPPPPANHVWRLWLRHPEKKKKVKQMSKYTTDRSWKEVAVTLSDDRGRCEVNLHEIDANTGDHIREPFRTLRMEPYMQLSRCKLQQYDKYGKLNIFKINHVSYHELPGMRPEKFSIKTFQNLISHKPKRYGALDHLPVYTEILKFGSMSRSLMRSLMSVLEDSLMRIPAHKDEGLNYNHEEVCCYVVDEYVGKISVEGVIEEQKARTRIFFSAFVNEGPHIVLGINDKWRFGREVVRRSDILPVMHDDWITIWKPEFHSCVEMNEYEKDHLLKFYPLDGCKFELMRFRVSLRHNQELPMQVHCSYSIDDRKISMRCELLVPGYFTATGKSEAIPCEDLEIRIPVPEEWIYHFRVEKHHKMGSVHSTLRKPGRIKGLERITQIAQSLLPPSLLEASIGLAKYEHLFKAIVWRIPRVPEKNESSYRPHLLTCNLLLNAHDTVPEWESLVKDVHIEFTMPSSTVSGTTVRSISVETTGNEEKFVKYTAKYRITKAINYQLGHRKDKPLKGILDADAGEPTSSDSEQEDEVMESAAARREESKDSSAGDELFGERHTTADAPPPSMLPTTPSTKQSDELADIFG
ncbi:unnamed protein product [Mesocestoides corti]|uniref:MHD domain-containing protein n=2 Tax=Mesocestoides corti TaxID=53468 RepID=A0A0R3UK72_MESCO|nr:unnamed protein product [Mesocestoides corti]